MFQTAYRRLLIADVWMRARLDRSCPGSAISNRQYAIWNIVF
jgi:hypothetical protein